MRRQGRWHRLGIPTSPHAAYVAHGAIISICVDCGWPKGGEWKWFVVRNNRDGLRAWGASEAGVLRVLCSVCPVSRKAGKFRSAVVQTIGFPDASPTATKCDADSRRDDDPLNKQLSALFAELQVAWRELSSAAHRVRASAARHGIPLVEWRYYERCDQKRSRRDQLLSLAGPTCPPPPRDVSSYRATRTPGICTKVLPYAV
eukprot:gene12853-biopygen1527